MPTETLIVVEGVQDQAVVVRLLSSEFTPVKEKGEVPEHWQRFIPQRVPKPNSLPIRIPSQPVFLKSTDGRSVMIRVAGSDADVAKALALDLKDLTGPWPGSIGILIDADEHDPVDRISRINSTLAGIAPSLAFPRTPGSIEALSSPRLGTYVLPNNRDPGGLEQLLMEGGSRNFPTLLSKAKAFVLGVEQTDVPRAPDGTERVWREFTKWNRSKAMIHAVGVVLKPARPIQASLQDDPWFEGPELPLLDSVRRFLLILAS